MPGSYALPYTLFSFDVGKHAQLRIVFVEERKGNMDEKKHIVYASDDYYFTYIYVSVFTLLRSNENLVIHYIQQDVSKVHLDLLKKMCLEAFVELDIIDFNMPQFFDILPAYGAASKTTYAKLTFCSMFPQYDRVLYLDPDTMVLGKIDEMYNMDMRDQLIGGVIENLPSYHREAAHLSPEDAYINGGMVLCNLAQWQVIGFEDKAIIRMQDTSMNLNYDQGIINELCKGKVCVLPPKYNALAEIFEFQDAKRLKARYGFINYYSQKEIEEAINNPVIIHFTHFLYGKPMSVKCNHPYAKLFQKIVLDSPLKDTLTSDDVDKKIKIRRFVLRNMPFSFYLFFEKVLDIRREKDMYEGLSR